MGGLKIDGNEGKAHGSLTISLCKGYYRIEGWGSEGREKYGTQVLQKTAEFYLFHEGNLYLIAE